MIRRKWQSGRCVPRISQRNQINVPLGKPVSLVINKLPAALWGKGTTGLPCVCLGTVFLFKLKRKKAVYTYADRPTLGPAGLASTPQLQMEASRVFCALGRQVREGWLN